MNKLLTLITMMFIALNINAKTLVVYYSYTNNCRTVATNLSSIIDADVLEVQPTEEGVQYDANNYAIGSALISAIRNNSSNASSYPSIKTTISNLADYNTVIIVTPLWWSNMAAPMQTFLFTYGSEMAGKNVGLVVSSASSGITSVESDAKRLVPGANWFSSSLHVRSSQTSGSSTMLSNWLANVNYNTITGIEQVETPSAVADQSLYLADGRRAQAYAKGIIISRTKLADGRLVTRKVIK